MPVSSNHVRKVQRALNHFTNKYLHHITPLVVDGVMGPATEKRIKKCKYYLGYLKKNRTGKKAYTTSRHFLRRLKRPKNILLAKPSTIKRGNDRRVEQRKRADANWDAGHNRHGVGTYDGKPVANWLIPYLDWARKHGWSGQLVSGWRDPVYSEHLCYEICGAPSCPGRCAGRASNHSGSDKPRGAVDVSDYATFGSLMRTCPHEPRIFNALGAQDPVHFSATGR